MQAQLHDIESVDDIKTLVYKFYEKVRNNETLGPIFNRVIQDNWDEHLTKMVTFWQSLLLGGERTYFGRPFPPHINLAINKTHFELWLSLFDQTLIENFSGAKADEAKLRAHNIADVFSHKLAMIHS